MCRAPGYLIYRRPHPVAPQPIRPTPVRPAAAEETFPLPIKAVSVEAKVTDFCSSVTVRQTFVNAESTPIEAIYQFELEEKATVSEFVALIDGNKIKGTIQEKEDAKNTYDDAIASGHGAYLMEEKEDEPNIFTVNVGNLPPGKSVDIAITYVTELEFDEGQQLKFRLPSNNDNPSYKAAAASSNSAPNLKLRVDFDMTSNIRSLSSPSHPITFEFGEEPNQATVTLSSDSAQAQVAKDLIVLTKLAKPHQACGRVEVDEKGTSKTVMVSLFPQLELADDEDIYTEMIFIVDRSGSMSGSRMNQVKDTLQIFLRSLGEGTMFNIIGFGTSTQHLFREGSVEYNDKNLEIATKHVKEMSANLGGTNILRPLQEVLRAQTKEGYPRQLFILTDGEVGNTQECVDFVRKHAETTRVFTFGVGNEASQDLVKGLAKAGEGFFEFVRSGEAMEEKVMRQLHRAMQPALTDITVTWKGAAARHVQPAPFRLPPLFCGGRLVVYGIIDDSAAAAAADEAGGGEVEVVIGAKTAVKPFEAVVKVDLSKASKGTLLNKLAARTLLKDLEEGRSYVHDREGAVKAGKDVVAEMVRVSLASGVLSKHTAFVAVEERDEATEGTMKVRKIPITFEKPVYHQPASHPVLLPLAMSHSSVSARGGGGPPQKRQSAAKPASGGFLSFFGGAKKGAAAPVQSSSSRDCKDKEKTKKKSVVMDRKREVSRSSAVEGGPPRAPMPISASTSACAPPPGRPMLAPSAAAASLEINQSLSRSPRSSSASPMLRSHSPPTDSLVFAKAEAEEECCAALDYDDDASSEDEEEPKFQVQKKEKKEEEKEEKKEEEKAGPPPAQMRDIIMKQKASGSWDWSDAAGLVGLTADKLRSGIPSAKLLTVDKEAEALWATAVVAAFLQKRFPGQKTNWDLVVKKALKFIARQKKNVKLASEREEIDWVKLATAFLP